MAKFFKGLGSVVGYSSVILGVFVLLTMVALLVYAFVFYVKKLKNAKTVKEAVKIAEEAVETGVSIKQSAMLLYLREYARGRIYEKEELFKTSSNPATVNNKCGAFKLDSVLKEIEMECIRKNYEYNHDYWIGYIEEEVKNMKGVK